MQTQAKFTRLLLVALMLLVAVMILLLGAALTRVPRPIAWAATEADVIHVDAFAPGGGDGTSWVAAYTDLQAALTDAGAGDQIWVAQGSYTPTVEHGGSGDRYRSFQMKNGVALYGGFNPAGGIIQFEQRDWEAYETILSGDLGTQGDPAENSYHVFFHPSGTTLDSSAILDGFTISGGYADGNIVDENSGAGMFNQMVFCNPALTNVTFDGNAAGSQGGGIYNMYGSPMLTNVSGRVAEFTFAIEAGTP